MHIEALVFVLNTFGYRANLVTGCHKQIFIHVFPNFGHDLSTFWSIPLHETPQTVRYMSVVYADQSISIYVENCWLQSKSSN